MPFGRKPKLPKLKRPPLSEEEMGRNVAKLQEAREIRAKRKAAEATKRALEAEAKREKNVNRAWAMRQRKAEE